MIFFSKPTPLLYPNQPNNIWVTSNWWVESCWSFLVRTPCSPLGDGVLWGSLPVPGSLQGTSPGVPWHTLLEVVGAGIDTLRQSRRREKKGCWSFLCASQYPWSPQMLFFRVWSPAEVFPMVTNPCCQLHCCCACWFSKGASTVLQPTGPTAEMLCWHAGACEIPTAFDILTPVFSFFYLSKNCSFPIRFYYPCSKAFICWGIKSFSEVQSESCPLLPPSWVFDYPLSWWWPCITLSQPGAPAQPDPVLAQGTSKPFHLPAAWMEKRNLNTHIHPTAISKADSCSGGVQEKKEKAIYFFQTQFLELFLEPHAWMWIMGLAVWNLLFIFLPYHYPCTLSFICSLTSFIPSLADSRNKGSSAPQHWKHCVCRAHWFEMIILFLLYPRTVYCYCIYCLLL